MSFAALRARMKQFDRNAEVIFDREEPIGAATDLVMPRRRWFARKAVPAINRTRPIRPLSK